MNRSIRLWRRRRCIGLAVTVFVAAATTPALAEDPVGDFGYTEWRTPGPDGTVYDASLARWDFRNTDEDEPTKQTEGCNGPMINRYPVSVRGYDDQTLVRPLVEGHISLEAVWGHIYDGGDCNAAAVLMVEGDDLVLDGARIDRAWDGVRPASRDDEFYEIRNVWLSNIRDDCVEADGSAPGLIQDSLFEGCFQGISMRAGSGNDSEYGHNTLTIESSLFHIRAYNQSEANGSDPRFTSGQLFKHKGRSANVIINDTVIAFDTPEFDGNFNQTSIMMGDAALGGRHGEDLISCANNEVLWLKDEDEAPIPSVLNELDPCFVVYSGAEARARWEEARCAWIGEHPPEVTRRLFDGEGEACAAVGGSDGGGGTEGGSDEGEETSGETGEGATGGDDASGSDSSAEPPTSSESTGGDSEGATSGSGGATAGGDGGCACTAGRRGAPTAPMGWALSAVLVVLRRRSATSPGHRGVRGP